MIRLSNAMSSPNFYPDCESQEWFSKSLKEHLKKALPSWGNDCARSFAVQHGRRTKRALPRNTRAPDGIANHSAASRRRTPQKRRNDWHFFLLNIVARLSWSDLTSGQEIPVVSTKAPKGPRGETFSPRPAANRREKVPRLRSGRRRQCKTLGLPPKRRNSTMRPEGETPKGQT